MFIRPLLIGSLIKIKQSKTIDRKNDNQMQPEFCNEPRSIFTLPPSPAPRPPQEDPPPRRPVEGGDAPRPPRDPFWAWFF